MTAAISYRRSISKTAPHPGRGHALVMGRSRDISERVEARFSLREVRETLLSGVTLLVAVADAFAFALYNALTSWLPTYYNEVMGLSLTHVGFITGALPFAGLIAVFVGGCASGQVP